MRFRKPELFPLLFIIGAVLLLGGLGVWQLERLQWKNTLIARIEQAQAAPALGTLPESLGGLEYRRVALTGTFLYDQTLHLIGVKQDEGNGFFLLTPFALEDDGRIILVNRGFSPPGKESRPIGSQTVTGVIRPLRQKRLFSPDNHPDKNVWFYEDIPAMAQVTGLQLLPVLVEETGTPQPHAYPIPADARLSVAASLRNDHLHYAITWFALALIGIVMFAAYHRIPNRPS